MEGAAQVVEPSDHVIIYEELSTSGTSVMEMIKICMYLHLRSCAQYVRTVERMFSKTNMRKMEHKGFVARGGGSIKSVKVREHSKVEDEFLETSRGELEKCMSKFSIVYELYSNTGALA